MEACDDGVRGAAGWCSEVPWPAGGMAMRRQGRRGPLASMTGDRFRYRRRIRRAGPLRPPGSSGGQPRELGGEPRREPARSDDEDRGSSRRQTETRRSVPEAEGRRRIPVAEPARPGVEPVNV